MMFSTPDSDNDAAGGSCSGNVSAWWFRRCASSCLNTDSIPHWTTGRAIANVKTSRMLVKFN